MEGEPERKRCGRCREQKPLDDLAVRRRASEARDYLCRSCRSAYGKEHYAANRQRYIDRASARKHKLNLERARFLLKFFTEHPCVDCGEGDPIVLEFDHLRDKAFCVGLELTRRPWKAILDEIEKCEVVCANCHRRRTATRRGALRVLMTEKPNGER